MATSVRRQQLLRARARLVDVEHDQRAGVLRHGGGEERGVDVVGVEQQRAAAGEHGAIELVGAQGELRRAAAKDAALAAHRIDEDDRGMAADAGAAGQAPHSRPPRLERSALPLAAVVVAERPDVGGAQAPALQRDQRGRHLAAGQLRVCVQRALCVDARRAADETDVIEGVEAEADDVEGRRWAAHGGRRAPPRRGCPR